MSRPPRHWTRSTVGAVCTVSRGSSPRPIADERYFEGGNIPWIKIADATKSGKYLYETKEKVNDFGASFSRLLPKGSLIVAASGTLGYTQMLGVSGCIHDGWLHLNSFNGIDEHFLYYWLKCQVERFTNAAYGAAIQNINTAIMRETEIDLPPIAEQRRIASILSAYDDLIENNTRRIAILEDIARRIYEEWFVRFRFPGHENVRMVVSEVGPVPEGWAYVSLNTLAGINARSIKRGKEPEEVTYVDISSVSTASINQRDRMKFTDAPGRARRIVKDGDIIWACVRPNRKSYAAIVDPDPGLIVSTGFAVLSATDVPWPYLYEAVTTEDFVGYLVNHAQGAAYPAVSADDFERAKVLRPDPATLHRFNAIVEPMLRLNAALARKNTNLRASRDLVLPKLISGELDVSSLPEPEAAAA